MFRLYEDPRSGNCFKVRLLLHHLGHDVERIPVDVLDPNRPQAVLDGNPAGRVPLLVTPEGHELPESNAILLYLAEGTRYLPSDPVARAHTTQWLFFEQNLHEPSIATARFWISMAEKPDHPMACLEMRQAAGTKVLKTMERWLASHDFFGAEGYDIADIALYGYTHVSDGAGLPLDDYSNIRAWLGRVEAQPGFIPMEAPAEA